MNKKIGAFFEERGFAIEGNCAYGKIDNFDASVFVAILDNVAPVRIQLSLHAVGPTRSRILDELRALKFKFFRVEANLYGIVLGFNGMTINSLLKQLPDMLEKIVSVLNKNGALGTGYCPLCGKQLVEGSYKAYVVENWIKVNIDEECVGKLNNAITKENEDFAKAPNNYLRGTLGALIGAVAGTIGYIILANFGVIGAISAFLAVFLGGLLFQKFGGKPTKVMVLIVAALSILSQLVAVFYIYYSAASVLAIEYNFASTGMAAFKDMMSIAEFKSEFTYNLIMTIVFTLLGVGSYIFNLIRQTKRKSTINK